jgi:hypothetical protein
MHNHRTMYCPNPKCPDFISTGKHGEYVASVTTCPYCGETLVESPPDPVEPPAETSDIVDNEPMPNQPGDDLEPIFETSDPTEVAVVRSFLDAQGIPHLVIGEERFDAFRGVLSPFRFNPRAGLVVFLVSSPYAEIARELLDDFDSGE